MTRRVMTADETRDRLIEAVFDHVPFDGWGEKALLAAAQECGIAVDAARRAFPGGAASLIEYHSARADRHMEKGLDAEALKGLDLGRRIAAAVRLRLEQETPHPEAVRAALAYLALPLNAALSLRCLYRTVDTMWFALGDKSMDLNFYSKRALLAGVYGSTLLYWLDDGSEDHEECWAFLDRRLEDVTRVGRLQGRLRSVLPSPEIMARLIKRRPARAFNVARGGRSGRP
ncbi:MAG TPA: COQ9 family protein [Alphaproteobacteria bacterium]|nr:COQ9 family protein [Alphaproteobacteria bacterium]